MRRGGEVSISYLQKKIKHSINNGCLPIISNLYREMDDISRPSKGGCSKACSAFFLLFIPFQFLWAVIYFLVVTPVLIVFAVGRTLVGLVFGNLPLFIFFLFTVGFAVSWIDYHSVTLTTVEQVWRCTIVPLILAPLPGAIRVLTEPYELGVCYYNALGLTNRILTTKPVTEILINDVNALSLTDPIFSLVKGLFDAVGRIARWALGFYSFRFPAYPVLGNLEFIIEVLLRLTNALCRDLHPGFFFVGRVIVDEQLYCAVDNFVNTIVARAQYWITFAYDLITTILSLIANNFITDFSEFVDQFRQRITDVSPVLNVGPERMAMAFIHVGYFLNNIIHKLICTILAEIELHQNDSTLVNGTVPKTHTSFKLLPGETYLREPVYQACVADLNNYYYNLFGVFGHFAAVAPRMQFVVERILPGNLFRIAWEVFFYAGPISDNGSLGYDIGTPKPNNSTRFLLSVTTIDAVWDTLRRPLDTLRTTSELERWPNRPLYGVNSDLYDPMANTTTTCGNRTTYTPPNQENLFCSECFYNTTEANVVTQLEILARNLDDLLEPLIDRRLLRPLLFEILGGSIRVIVAVAKFVVDVPRHLFSGVEEALIFFARQSNYDVIFDEVAGKPHELGGVANGVVNFFAAIFPSLHIIPKVVILPGKVVAETARTVVRILPILLNTLKTIGANPTFGPTLTEFFCIDGAPTCIDIEEQFVKWLRTPRNRTQTQFIINQHRVSLSSVLSAGVANKMSSASADLRVFDLGSYLSGAPDMVRINAVFNQTANNYTGLLYGDVYDPNANVPAFRFGWLECIRYFFSPAFINSFIPNPVDHITSAQFPDITCGLYYPGRAAAEGLKFLSELVMAVVQTITDLFSGPSPTMPAVIFRWLACESVNVCFPVLEALSDAEDFVQCPCELLGETFLNTPCICNVTNSLGFAAVQLLRASINVELSASQLIICITEFPNGATTIPSRGCYQIVFDRVIDIFNKSYAATEDASLFGAGIGCIIGSFNPFFCGSLPPGQRLNTYTSELGYYAVQILFSLIRSALSIVESFFQFLRGLVIGSTPTNPAIGFTFRNVVETLLDSIIIPLVGDTAIPGSRGFVQTLGLSFSCVFGTSSCNIALANSPQCPGNFLVLIGNKIRTLYDCIKKVIGNAIGFFENLFAGSDVGPNITGFFEGIICFIADLATSLLDIFLSVVGSILDAIFNTGTTITNFLQGIGDVIVGIIDILSALFFGIGEGIDCSLCWTTNYDIFDQFFQACADAWCICKCNRPGLPGVYCRLDWDQNGFANDNEAFPGPVNRLYTCPAKRKRSGEEEDLDPQVDIMMEQWMKYDAALAAEADAMDTAAISSPYPKTEASGKVANVYTTLQEYAEWEQARAYGSSSVLKVMDKTTLCGQYLYSIFEENKQSPDKFSSIDVLLADKSFTDRAFFYACYTAMVIPGILNEQSSFTVHLPKYLALDRNQIKLWVASSTAAVQTYINWADHNSNIEVSPTLLQALLTAQQNTSMIVYNQSTLAQELDQPSLKQMKRYAMTFTRPGTIAANVPSFMDAVVLSGNLRNPNLKPFIQQLDDYTKKGRITERAAATLSTALQIAQKSTLFDGIIAGIQSLKSAFVVVDPITWTRTVAEVARTTAASTRDSQLNMKLISDAMNSKALVATADSTYYGPYGSRNNPNFKVMAGTSPTDKLVSMVSFYSRVWNTFSSRAFSLSSQKVSNFQATVNTALQQSEAVLRMLETYQYLQHRLGEHLHFAPLPAQIANWAASVRTNQARASMTSLLAVNQYDSITHTQNSIFNSSQCNVTRCFECAIIVQVLEDIVELFQYCVRRSLGDETVVRKLNITTIDEYVATLDSSDTDQEGLVDNSLLFGLGRYINIISIFVVNGNVDPFTNTGKPLGLWFYISAFAPIPFVGSCDRDLHTTCQFGIGFGWGLLILIALTVVGIVLWIFIPPMAGVLTTLMSILGYILFVLTIVMVVSWGMNPLCLQSPSISLLTLIGIPVQLPILPDCAIRDIAATFETIVQPCFAFLEAIVINSTSPLACPSCPTDLLFVDCRTKGFNTPMDVVGFGVNWIVGDRLLPMNIMLDTGNPEHQTCFWLLGSVILLFGSVAVIIGLVYLVPLLVEVGIVILGALAYLAATVVGMFAVFC